MTESSSYDDVENLLTEINMNGSYEFGDPSAANIRGRRNNITAFKRDAISGKYTLEHLILLHPKLCRRHFGLIQRFYEEMTVKPQRETALDDMNDWIKAGSPKGLPLKVYRSWKKGEMYAPSNKESMTATSLKGKMNTIVDQAGNGLAYHVFRAWLNGEMYNPR